MIKNKKIFFSIISVIFALIIFNIFKYPKPIKTSINGKVVEYKKMMVSKKIAVELASLSTKNCTLTYKMKKAACEKRITDLYNDVLVSQKVSGSDKDKLKWIKNNVEVLPPLKLDENIATALLYYTERITVDYKLKTGTKGSFTKLVRMKFDPKLDNGSDDAIEIFEDFKKLNK